MFVLLLQLLEGKASTVLSDHKFLTRTASVLITCDKVFRPYINTDLQSGTSSNLYGHYVV
jgi:hypothetical protein